MADIEVSENPAEHRFEIRLDGVPVGFTGYDVRGPDYALTHTEIDPGHAGQGLASALIRQTLETLRAGGFGVLPYCSFVRAFVQKHPKYVDLVPAARRAEFGLEAG